MLTLRTLGALGLAGPCEEALGQILSQPKRHGLFVYLAVARPRGFHRRDTILSLFWPDADESRARGALSRVSTICVVGCPRAFWCLRVSERSAWRTIMS